MDPLRSDTRPAEALSGAERDARIEQLLLAGLDEYFAHHYEQAINLWTRVLFLDRTHDRARAYIERARSAQAERAARVRGRAAPGHRGAFRRATSRARGVWSPTRSIAARRPTRRRACSIASSGSVPVRPRRRSAARSPRGGRARTSPQPAANAWQCSRARPSSPRRGHGWIAAALLVAAAIGAFAVGAWGVAIPEPATWPIFRSATFSRTRARLPIARQAAAASRRHREPFSLALALVGDRPSPRRVAGNRSHPARRSAARRRRSAARRHSARSCSPSPPPNVRPPRPIRSRCLRPNEVPQVRISRLRNDRPLSQLRLRFFAVGAGRIAARVAAATTGTARARRSPTST